MSSAPAIAAAPSAFGHDVARSTDPALVALVAGGDVEAFDELYRRHNRRVLMHARKLCSSKELAEEVTQEAFVSLWRSAHLYTAARGNVSSWLSSMVRNRAIDAWRRAAVRPVEAEALEDYDLGARDAAGDASPYAERAAALSLLADLPDEQKEALFLAFYGGLTHAEIATGTDQPLGTIKSRIRLGLQRLRYAIEEQASDARAQARPARPALRLVDMPC